MKEIRTNYDDLMSVVPRQFMLFMRENPTWLDGVDWNDPFSECRFSLVTKRVYDELSQES